MAAAATTTVAAVATIATTAQATAATTAAARTTATSAAIPVATVEKTAAELQRHQLQQSNSDSKINSRMMSPQVII